MLFFAAAAMALTSAPRHLATVSHRPAHQRANSVTLFFGGGKLPAEIEETLAPSIDAAEVLPLWREMRKCYPNERAAIDGALKTPLVILPFFNTAETIKLDFRILGELGFSDQERFEIVQKNPGVLANKPYDLATSTPDEIRSSVELVSAVESIPKPIRLAIPTLTAVGSVAAVAQRLNECQASVQGGICG